MTHHQAKYPSLRWGMTVLAMALASTLVAAFPSDQQTPSPDDPLALFTRTMPVFSHARCINCHGATDPFAPRMHPERVEAGVSCSSCHVEENSWQLGPDFVGQTARQLCEMMAGSARNLTPAGFLHHLENDALITQSWTGLAGGARDVPPAPAPLPVPPMSHRAFQDAAKVWLEDGLGLCDREGEIRYVERIESNEGYPQGPSPTTRVQQAGTRTVTIRFANGRYQSTVQVEGSVLIEKTITGEVNGRPCQVVITSTQSYADVDDQTPGSFNLGITRQARVGIKFGSGGNYTVTVHLPAEKHRHMDGGSVVDGCGVPLEPGEHDNTETEWPATSFSFRGTLPDPLDRRQLRGNSTRTVTSRVSDLEDPWLWDHYAAAAPLDRPTLHPVTVTVNWNFKYRP